MTKRAFQTDALRHEQRRARRPDSQRAFMRSKNKQIGGVAAGIAEYTQSNPTTVRVIFLLAIVMSLGIGLLPYIIAWLLVPLENQ